MDTSGMTRTVFLAPFLVTVIGRVIWNVSKVTRSKWQRSHLTPLMGSTVLVQHCDTAALEILPSIIIFDPKTPGTQYTPEAKGGGVSDVIPDILDAGRPGAATLSLGSLWQLAMVSSGDRRTRALRPCSFVDSVGTLAGSVGGIVLTSDTVHFLTGSTIILS